jgi:uncharacterized protein
MLNAVSIALSAVVPRRLADVIAKRMQDEPVLVLQGPRAVGKSTLLQAVSRSCGRAILDLDDLETRDAVSADPALFMGAERPVLVDEFQHEPAVLDAIKAELNADSSPGRFVLTGSTRYATLPTAAQALTGRAHLIDVRPLSQGEIAGAREDFAQLLLQDPAMLVAPASSSTSRAEYVHRIVGGGFPLALRRAEEGTRARWFDDYLRLVIERDVLALTRVRQRQQLPRLLRRLASQTGRTLNIARSATALDMDKSTAENYTKLLEAVFLIDLLPSWGTTLGSRVAAAPKLHMVDSGLAARLLRITEKKLMEVSPSAMSELGHLLETFVVGEVCKQLDWVDEPVTCGHFRTHDGDEVDLVVERMDGSVAAVEVKAGSRPPAATLDGLRALRRKLGKQFLGGVVLYTGSRPYTIEDRLHVVPLDRLWRGSKV